MIIIGITGTLGAGKGTIVDLLKEKGFLHFSARDFIVETIEKEEMIVNRDSMTIIGNRLRQEHNPSYIIENLYNRAKETGKNSVIESVRNPKEVEFLRQKEDFILIAVDADIRTRYKRILERKSSTDNVSFETFQENEEREMQSNDINSQNLRACIKESDILVDNSGTIEDFKEKIEEIWKKIEKR
ncbi:MAG: AAA family ATPase [Bacteroidales bacterium]|nr:AAA family ATPase [Bacteroidales bacterium]